jgi:signal peptide peptidase-like protein 2B
MTLFLYSLFFIKTMTSMLLKTMFSILLFQMVLSVTSSQQQSLPRFAGSESNYASSTLLVSNYVLHPGPIVSELTLTGKKVLVNTLPVTQELSVQLIHSNTASSTGCSPHIQLPLSLSTTSWALVVERGNCTFETKLQHAQAAGANALFVMNTPEALKTGSGVLNDVCSVYAHHTSDGTLECDTDAICDDDGKIEFKLSNTDTMTGKCCVDVDRSVSLFRTLGTMNRTIPFLFLSIPDSRALAKVMLQSSNQIPNQPLQVVIKHRVAGFDGSSLCTWAIGVVAVFVSCYFAATKERQEAQKKFWLPLGDSMMEMSRSRQDEDGDDDAELVEILTWKHAIAMLCCSGITLLLLYALIKAGFQAMILVMQIFFGYAITVATYRMVFYPMLRRVNVLHRNKRTVQICGEDTVCSGSVPVSVLLSISVAVFWGITRHESWSWLLLDALGLLVCCLVVQTMRIAGLRAATILLVLFFLYDIFMVFITPSIFGDSVMVEVATGGGANLPSTSVRNSSIGGNSGGNVPHRVSEECVRTPGENIPMLFMFPRFSGWPGGNSMLGYGDIIFPSILISHVLRFDYAVRGRMCCGRSSSSNEEARGRTQPRDGCTYFPFLVVGYGVGLLLAFLANYFQLTINGVHGQPALLYLVPCTLGLHLILSHVKGELSEQWLQVESNDIEEDNHCSSDDVEVTPQGVPDGDEDGTGDLKEEREEENMHRCSDRVSLLS